MDLLERQYLNGRYSTESCIFLKAHWVDGWRFKDGKWKYEEEARLDHIDPAWFRCRVHLYAFARTDITQEVIRGNLEMVNTSFVLEGVSAQFCGAVLGITIPLRLDWSETENESMNPKIFRYFESMRLPIGGCEYSSLQILVTYRNLNKLYGSSRMFKEKPMQRGYQWLGSMRVNS